LPHGLISVLIPIAVIVLAIITKRIIPCLIVGILLGGIALEGGNIVSGIIAAADHIIKSAASKESIYIIFFLFLFGALAEIIKVAGGIKGFVKLTEKSVKTERGALAAIWAVTPVTFIDCCFHDIAAGTIAKALVKKVDGNKKRLAFVLNVTSCLLIIIIPFGTTYVGYIMGLITSALSKADISGYAYQLYLRSIPYNFYSIVMIVISILVIIFNFGFNKEVKTEEQDSEFAKEHGLDEANEQCTFAESVAPRPFNLILPLAFLIVSTFFLLWLTGKSYGGGFGNALIHADFEKSIFISSLISVVVTAIYYLIQKMPLKEIETHFLSGGGEMIPPIVILILSWGLASIVANLGFVEFATGFVRHIPLFLLPVAIYLIGCFVSYFMGTAWGTWALLMPMAVPLAVSTGSSLALVIGAVLAGGALGDNASPLGETAVLSATIAEVPVMEHVKSQLPFCLTGVIISAALFIIFSLI